MIHCSKLKLRIVYTVKIKQAQARSFISINTKFNKNS